MDGAVVAHNRASEADTLEANLGLYAELIGDPPSISRRIAELEQAGVDAIMVKCEPAFEETERFAREIRAPYRTASRATGMWRNARPWPSVDRQGPSTASSAGNTRTSSRASALLR